MKSTQNILLFHLVILFSSLSVCIDGYSEELGQSVKKRTEKAGSAPQINTTFITRKFENSRAGRVAQLQAIRMHNVLRTVSSKTNTANIVGPKEGKISEPINLKGDKVTKKVIVSALNRPVPISDKRLKVQKWEEIYQ